MQDTINKDKWYFYHDALSLMTCADSIEWMKKEGIYKHWLLPCNGLNEGTDYSDKPTGNSPEFMPLDCSLFQDIYLALSRHIIYTGCLDKNDPKKFSFSSLQKATHSFSRLWTGYDKNQENANEGYPSSERIMQDIEKIVTSLKTVHDAKGIAVQGLGNRSGIRYTPKGGWGGSRVKDIFGDNKKTKWTHEDAVEAKNMIIEQALKDMDEKLQVTRDILLDEVKYEDDDDVEV